MAEKPPEPPLVLEELILTPEQGIIAVMSALLEVQEKLHGKKPN